MKLFALSLLPLVLSAAVSLSQASLTRDLNAGPYSSLNVLDGLNLRDRGQALPTSLERLTPNKLDSSLGLLGLVLPSLTYGRLA